MSANTRNADQTAPVCSLGLDRATIAAWHDGALAAGEAAHIERHVATCPVCRARLAGFERVEGIVRSERVPMPDTRLWAAVRAGHVGRLRPVKSKRPLIGGLGALAAVLLLALGFAQLFRIISAPPAATKTATAQASPTVAPSATPSATSVVPNALTWTPIAMPPGFDVANSPSIDLVVSPSDANTAYACFFPTGAGPETPPQLWATHSLGAHWAQASLPAQGIVNGLNGCFVVADSSDANGLVVGLGAEQASKGPPAQFFASFTGGASWQALPANLRVLSLAAYRGSTYVVTQNTAPGPSNLVTHLQVSTDGLRTLHPIDGALTTQGSSSPIAVWVKPGTGELLALVAQGTHGQALYTSRDGGGAWNMLTSIPEGQLVAALPRAGQPWRVCRYIDAEPLFECDLDGNPQGRFTSRPFPPRGYLWLASDGTLLDVALTPPNARTPTPELFTLAPGASAWSDRGPLPEPQVIDALTASGDLLWALPPANGTQSDPQGRVFVARLA